ncbi:MAG: hypothetical protein J0I43_14345 [Microbacterium sp.]|uniref:hypothetical protein n=1 Tax=Microbacterium sp. TaxID=51671 RepID=UPI001AD0D788|nr:hypothetical protein [Microbacterium sp.]MBN9178529.1 hypothetical protein [Microbacterium sp.]
MTTIAIVASLVVTPLATSTPVAAANASDWDPGNIISDALFYDSNAMSAPEIQAFLNARVPTCRTTEVPCLKDYAQSTDDRVSDRYCNGYVGRSRETAAQIIDNVARSCGISQKVLLVLLEKEQSLVTSSRPNQWSYTAATGQGCPDNAPCNPATSGFFYQVYYAARQYEIYRLTPTQWGYQAGRWNTILYSPDRACGTRSVYIQNQATAALYIYTPYTPNEAALTDLYGEGDDCSTHGNRNFWRLYTDWFGLTRVDAKSRIDATYVNFGGGSGWLGPATGDYVCGLVDGGCYRPYTNGRVYASNRTAGVSVSPAIQPAWDEQSAQDGVFGYPQAEAFADRGGWMQSYAGGVAVVPDGRVAQFVAGPIGLAWLNAGGFSSKVGAPTSRLYCVLVSAGCVQVFANAWYYASPSSGAHYVSGPILQAWSDRGSENGTLGYPLSEPVHDLIGGGDWAQFQGGILYVDLNGRSWVVGNEMAQAYLDAYVGGSPLGAPLGEISCSAGNCLQQFTSGYLVKASGSDTRVVAGPIGAAWLAAGAFSSSAGAPLGPMYCGLVRGGCLQMFSSGWYYWSPSSGAYLVSSALLQPWSVAGSERGAFGYPLGAPVAVSGGSVQSFQGGVGVVSTSGAAQFVAGPIGAAWLAAGAFSSSAGAPLGPMSCDASGRSCSQPYSAGTFLWSATDGVSFKAG